MIQNKYYLFFVYLGSPRGLCMSKCLLCSGNSSRAKSVLTAHTTHSTEKQCSHVFLECLFYIQAGLRGIFTGNKPPRESKTTAHHFPQWRDWINTTRGQEIEQRALRTPILTKNTVNASTPSFHHHALEVQLWLLKPTVLSLHSPVYLLSVGW